MGGDVAGSTEKQETKPTEGLLPEFVHSMAYAALQEPLNGLTQIVDQVTAQNFLPKVQFLDPPEKSHGTADWVSQQVGSAIGMLVPLLAVRGGLRYGLGESLKGANTAATLGMSVKEAGLTGFAYSALVQPTDPESTTNFWVGRGLSGATGAATFMTMTGASAGLGKLAETAPMTKSGLNQLIANPIATGLLSGIPAGLVSAEGSSLASQRRLASGQDLVNSVAGMSLVGGIFGANEAVKARFTEGKPAFPYLAEKANETLKAKITEGRPLGQYVVDKLGTAWTASPLGARGFASGDVDGATGMEHSVAPETATAGKAVQPGHEAAYEASNGKRAWVEVEERPIGRYPILPEKELDFRTGIEMAKMVADRDTAAENPGYMLMMRAFLHSPDHADLASPLKDYFALAEAPIADASQTVEQRDLIRRAQAVVREATMGAANFVVSGKLETVNITTEPGATESTPSLVSIQNFAALTSELANASPSALADARGALFDWLNRNPEMHSTAETYAQQSGHSRVVGALDSYLGTNNLQALIDAKAAYQEPAQSIENEASSGAATTGDGHAQTKQDETERERHEHFQQRAQDDTDQSERGAESTTAQADNLNLLTEKLSSNSTVSYNEKVAAAVELKDHFGDLNNEQFQAWLDFAFDNHLDRSGRSLPNWQSLRVANIQLLVSPEIRNMIHGGTTEAEQTSPEGIARAETNRTLLRNFLNAPENRNSDLAFVDWLTSDNRLPPDRWPTWLLNDVRVRFKLKEGGYSDSVPDDVQEYLQDHPEKLVKKPGDKYPPKPTSLRQDDMASRLATLPSVLAYAPEDLRDPLLHLGAKDGRALNDVMRTFLPPRESREPLPAEYTELLRLTAPQAPDIYTMKVMLSAITEARYADRNNNSDAFAQNTEIALEAANQMSPHDDTQQRRVHELVSGLLAGSYRAPDVRNATRARSSEIRENAPQNEPESKSKQGGAERTQREAAPKSPPRDHPLLSSETGIPSMPDIQELKPGFGFREPKKPTDAQKDKEARDREQNKGVWSGNMPSVLNPALNAPDSPSNWIPVFEDLHKARGAASFVAKIIQRLGVAAEFDHGINSSGNFIPLVRLADSGEVGAVIFDSRGDAKGIVSVDDNHLIRLDDMQSESLSP